jgi:hypothetical protein
MGLGPYPAWALDGRTCPPMLRAGPGKVEHAPRLPKGINTTPWAPKEG